MCLFQSTSRRSIHWAKSARVGSSYVQTFCCLFLSGVYKLFIEEPDSKYFRLLGLRGKLGDLHNHSKCNYVKMSKTFIAHKGLARFGSWAIVCWHLVCLLPSLPFPHHLQVWCNGFFSKKEWYFSFLMSDYHNSLVTCTVTKIPYTVVYAEYFIYVFEICTDVCPYLYIYLCVLTEQH